MTYPGPTTRRRLLNGHTEQEMLELEARRGIHAGLLPSNRGDALDGLTGGVAAAEGGMRGWTSQQPFVHVDCPVAHLCILCAGVVEPDYLKEHRCKVKAELAIAV